MRAHVELFRRMTVRRAWPEIDHRTLDLLVSLLRKGADNTVLLGTSCHDDADNGNATSNTNCYAQDARVPKSPGVDPGESGEGDAGDEAKKPGRNPTPNWVVHR